MTTADKASSDQLIAQDKFMAIFKPWAQSRATRFKADVPKDFKSSDGGDDYVHKLIPASMGPLQQKHIDWIIDSIISPVIATKSGDPASLFSQLLTDNIPIIYRFPAYVQEQFLKKVIKVAAAQDIPFSKFASELGAIMPNIKEDWVSDRISKLSTPKKLEFYRLFVQGSKIGLYVSKELAKAPLAELVAAAKESALPRDEKFWHEYALKVLEYVKTTQPRSLSELGDVLRPCLVAAHNHMGKKSTTTADVIAILKHVSPQEMSELLLTDKTMTIGLEALLRHLTANIKREEHDALAEQLVINNEVTVLTGASLYRNHSPELLSKLLLAVAHRIPSLPPQEIASFLTNHLSKAGVDIALKHAIPRKKVPQEQANANSWQETVREPLLSACIAANERHQGLLLGVVADLAKKSVNLIANPILFKLNEIAAVTDEQKLDAWKRTGSLAGTSLLVDPSDDIRASGARLFRGVSSPEIMAKLLIHAPIRGEGGLTKKEYAKALDTLGVPDAFKVVFRDFTTKDLTKRVKAIAKGAFYNGLSDVDKIWLTTHPGDYDRTEQMAKLGVVRADLRVNVVSNSIPVAILGRAWPDQLFMDIAKTAGQYGLSLPALLQLEVHKPGTILDTEKLANISKLSSDTKIPSEVLLNLDAKGGLRLELDPTKRVENAERHIKLLKLQDRPILSGMQLLGVVTDSEASSWERYNTQVRPDIPTDLATEYKKLGVNQVSNVSAALALATKYGCIRLDKSQRQTALSWYRVGFFGVEMDFEAKGFKPAIADMLFDKSGVTTDSNLSDGVTQGEAREHIKVAQAIGKLAVFFGNSPHLVEPYLQSVVGGNTPLGDIHKAALRGELRLFKGVASSLTEAEAGSFYRKTIVQAGSFKLPEQFEGYDKQGWVLLATGYPNVLNESSSWKELQELNNGRAPATFKQFQALKHERVNLTISKGGAASLLQREVDAISEAFKINGTRVKTFLELNPAVPPDVDAVPNVMTTATQDGETKYTLRKVDRTDPVGPLLGEIIECCQTIDNGAGASCAASGWASKEAAFYVFEKGGVPLAQAYVWNGTNADGKKVLVFDNFEAGKNTINAVALANTVASMTQHLIDNHGYAGVHVGVTSYGCTKAVLAALKTAKTTAADMVDGKDYFTGYSGSDWYRDSNTQVQVIGNKASIEVDNSATTVASRTLPTELEVGRLPAVACQAGLVWDSIEDSPLRAGISIRADWFGISQDTQWHSVASLQLWKEAANMRLFFEIMNGGDVGATARIVNALGQTSGAVSKQQWKSVFSALAEAEDTPSSEYAKYLNKSEIRYEGASHAKLQKIAHKAGFPDTSMDSANTSSAVMVRLELEGKITPNAAAALVSAYNTGFKQYLNDFNGYARGYSMHKCSTVAMLSKSEPVFAEILEKTREDSAAPQVVVSKATAKSARGARSA